ncbi:MAG: hypothetical protein ACRBBQ_12555 [Cognatishimia sp.]
MSEVDAYARTRADRIAAVAFMEATSRGVSARPSTDFASAANGGNAGCDRSIGMW